MMYQIVLAGFAHVMLLDASGSVCVEMLNHGGQKDYRSKNLGRAAMDAGIRF